MNIALIVVYLLANLFAPASALVPAPLPVAAPAPVTAESAVPAPVKLCQMTVPLGKAGLVWLSQYDSARQDATYVVRNSLVKASQSTIWEARINNVPYQLSWTVQLYTWTQYEQIQVKRGSLRTKAVYVKYPCDADVRVVWQ